MVGDEVDSIEIGIQDGRQPFGFRLNWNDSRASGQYTAHDTTQVNGFLNERVMLRCGYDFRCCLFDMPVGGIFGINRPLCSGLFEEFGWIKQSLIPSNGIEQCLFKPSLTFR